MLSSKKILKTSLISALVAVFLPFLAHAAAYNVSTELMLTALLSTGAEITLTDDITISSGHVPVNAESVLDLNGHTLDLTNKVLITYEKLTIKDSSAEQTGRITCSNYYYCIQVGNSNNPGQLVIDSGTIETDSSEYTTIYNIGNVEMNGGVLRGSVVGIQSQANNVADINTSFIMRGGLIQTTADGVGVVNRGGAGSVFEMYGGKIDATSFADPAVGGAGVGVYKDATAHFYDGEIDAYSFAIYTNGSNSDNAKIVIDDGYYRMRNPKGPAIYIPGRYAETTINGGTFEGPTAVEIRAGTLIINGGTFKGDTENYLLRNNTNGSTTDGAAISIAQHTTKQPITVIINGGEFEAYSPISFTNPIGNSQEDLNKISIIINGGYFETDDEDMIITPDNQPMRIITGGVFSHSISDYVADGYGEIPYSDDGSVEVVPYHTITVQDDSVSNITLSVAGALYKQEVSINVVDDPDKKEIVEIVDENGNVYQVGKTSFVMPDSNVTIRVSYTDFAKYHVLFRVANGTWEDGTSDDIEIEISESDNGPAILNESDLPAGMLAAAGFTNGSWDAVIGNGVAMTNDLVLTFTFEETDLDIPNTGAKVITKDEGIKNGSTAGIIVLAAAVVVVIAGLAYVAKGAFVGDVEE